MRVRKRNSIFCQLITIVLILTLGLQMTLNNHAHLAEKYYGMMVFPKVRLLLDKLMLPISGIQVSLVIILFLILGFIARFIVDRRPIRKKAFSLTLRMYSLIAVLVIIFYWFWGFNYSRPVITERMKWAENEPNKAWIKYELDQTVSLLNALRSKKNLENMDADSLTNVAVDHTIQSEIVQRVLQIIELFNYRIEGRPGIRFIRPPGFLLHWSTAGIYWPFTGESNIDDGVHYLRKPVTMAHELAHAFGVTSEGDCNFIAYLVCSSSRHDILKYGAALSYLNYLLKDASQLLSDEEYNDSVSRILPKVHSDRLSIAKQHSQFEDYLPLFRNLIYDSYLKSQGIQDGLANYNYFVNLMYNLKKSDASVYSKMME